MAQQFTITVNIAAIGKSFIGVTEVGGFTIRGGRADNMEDAVRSVLYKLTDKNMDESALGLELALAGTTINDVAQLDPPAGPESVS